MTDEGLQRLIREGLLKGCIGGLVLVVVFLAVSGLFYVILTMFGFDFELKLFVSTLSGPVVGTTVAICYYSQMLKRTNQKEK